MPPAFILSVTALVRYDLSTCRSRAYAKACLTGNITSCGSVPRRRSSRTIGRQPSPCRFATESRSGNESHGRVTSYDCACLAWIEWHIAVELVESRHRDAKPPRRAAPSLPFLNPPTRFHLDAGSSSRSKTSCSAARERIRSSTSWSATSMISATNCRTWEAVSGFHWRNLVSSFSIKASIRISQHRPFAPLAL
jgi:hypothetical protein